MAAGSILFPVVYVKDTISGMYQGYVDALKYADRRTDKWLLMNSPIPTLVMIALYLLIVRFGPQLMRDRKPFHLKWPLVIYNFSLMLLNLFISSELIYCAFYKRRYYWFCQLVDTSDDKYEHRIASTLWWYYFSKLIEFSDTIFFVLRKKDKQLTFLHVYHHSTMFGLWWIGVKWVPGGSAVPGATVNGYVHVLMYSYYGLSALGPRIQKYLWWKKYITIVQLIQFVFALSCGLYTLWINCNFTKWMQYAFVTYAFSFILLFGNFYLNAYIKERGRHLAADNKKKDQTVNGHIKLNGKAHQQQSNGAILRKRSPHF